MADFEYLTVPHLQRKHLRRLFSKIRVDKAKGCWEWTGGLNTQGYAQTSVLNIRTTIHRVMYAWLVAPIPKGVGKHIPQLDHFVCDHRICVNPSHLKLVTCRENALRGKGQSAINAAKTHCKNGHLFPPPAQQSNGGRWRRCKLCQKRDARMMALHRVAQRAYVARRKQKHQATTQRNDADLSPVNTNQGEIPRS